MYVLWKKYSPLPGIPFNQAVSCIYPNDIHTIFVCIDNEWYEVDKMCIRDSLRALRVPAPSLLPPANRRKEDAHAPVPVIATKTSNSPIAVSYTHLGGRIKIIPERHITPCGYKQYSHFFPGRKRFFLSAAARQIEGSIRHLFKRLHAPAIPLESYFLISDGEDVRFVVPFKRCV